MSVHTLIFSASSAGGITPYNSNVVNGETESMYFQYSSGDYPTAGAELKRIRLDLTHVKVYSTHEPYLSCIYGDFYLGAASDDTRAVSADFVNANRSILSFSGGTIPFTVCSGTADNVGILNIRSSCTATLTIEWEPRTASTGVLSSTTGVQGKNISLSIRAIDSTFTHYISWYRDSTHYQGQSIAAGITTATFTVPTTWPVGAATVYLTTYYGNQIVGATQAYSWTIVVDGDTTFPTAGSLAVTLTQHSAIPSSWGVYVQGYSSAQLTLTGYSAGNTASISDITLKLGSLSKSGSSNIYSTPALTETGQLSSSAVVTNSFGNSASVAGQTITVYAYESPKINSILAYRCLSDGVANDYGTYIAVTTNVSISSVNSKNAIVTLQCQWRVRGSTDNWSTGVNVSNGSTTIINAGLAPNSTIYEIRIVLIDTIQSNLRTSTTKTSIILTSDCILFFKDGGLNVSVGMQGTKDNAIEINENWKIWKGDIQLDGTVEIGRGGTGATTIKGARKALGLGETDGAVPVANGGTGAATAAGARKNLGLGETDGALPIANGGTGSANAQDARRALGITPGNIGAAPTNHAHSFVTITGTVSLSQLPFKIARGSIQINAGNGTYIDYSSVGFSQAPTIVGSYSTENANWAGDGGPIKFYSKTSSGAYCIIGGSYSARNIDWIAIGI